MRSFALLAVLTTLLCTSSASPLSKRANGPGIHLTNKGTTTQTFNFYDNYWNGVGTAGANFDHPMLPTTLAAGKTTFVSLPTTFKGRVQRGTQLPATWVEFQISASDDHGSHGDVSVQQGCDGAATIASTDNKSHGGFTQNVLVGAPEAAYKKKPNGQKVIDSTVGGFTGVVNQAAVKWMNEKVGQVNAYITGGTGVPDVSSKNQQLAVVFY
ncbi:hypothetical protein B0J14DRAFT_600010 [Halenospora varia]|nr:hypothetical protein B0J14DRAFT_600010 [Halenospora varia]